MKLFAGFSAQGAPAPGASASGAPARAAGAPGVCSPGPSASGASAPGAAPPAGSARVTPAPVEIPGGDPLVARALALGVILVAGFVRLLSCWEGLPYLHNWDEPQIAGTALHMMQTGDFNPGFFNYGSLPVYLCLFTDVLHYLFLMGCPETAPPFLTSLGDIRTAFDTGWHWTISHPSFYLWDRWVFALLGTATVGVAYLLGRRLAGRWAGLAAAAQDAWRALSSPETRTEAIRRAAALTSGNAAPARVGIAEELRVHGDDLRDLDEGIQTVPYLDLVCDGAPYEVVVRAKRWGSYGHGMEPIARVMNALSPPGLIVRDTVGRAASLRLDAFSTNPAIEILARAPGAATVRGPCIDTFRTSDLTMDPSYEIDAADGVIRMHTWGRVSTPWIDLPAGSYAFVWRARGTFGDGEFAKLRVAVEEAAQDGGRRILLEETHELTGDLRPYALEFAVEEAGFLSLNVEFINDYYSRGRREDRDAYVAEIRLLDLGS